MRVRFRITRNGETPEDREFVSDALQIGRAPSSDLTIPDDRSQTVSWHHARIETTSEGAWLHDLRSTNGTFINGRKLEQPERLRRGDMIRLGQTGPTLEVLEIDCTPPPLPAPPLFRRAESPPPTPRSVPRPRSSAAKTPVSATRALLMQVQRKHKSLLFLGGWAAVMLMGVIGIILWNHEGRIDRLEVDLAKVADLETDVATIRNKQADIDQSTQDMYARIKTLEQEAARDNGAAIYQRTVLSTAWLHTNRGEGTGSVVEHDGKKLIVTAYHVVHQANTIRAIFPKFLNGKVLANQAQYHRDGPPSDEEPSAITCTLWAVDASLDLAILEPLSLPKQISPLQIARESAAAGAKVHTIGGHPAGTQGLWSYTGGEVRQVAQGNFRFRNGQQITAKIVETTNPVNHGDSGGPLVNSKCQLVGVTSGGVDGANSIAKFIDVGHVRDMLKSRPNKPLVVSTPGPPLAMGPSVPSVPTPPAAPLGHVHILLLMDDTCPKIGPSVVNDKNHLLNTFRRGLPSSSYTVDVRMGTQATKAYVADYYRRLLGKVGPNDAVFCYYSGHGCMVRPATHYLSLMNHREPLERNYLLNTMRSVGGKATILITDCCSSFPRETRDLELGVSEFAGSGEFLVPLLLQHRGIVDWQAASPGEAALGNVFTPIFCNACSTGRYRQWPDLFAEVKQQAVNRTIPVFRRDPRQKQQTPYVFPTTNIRPG